MSDNENMKIYASWIPSRRHYGFYICSNCFCEDKELKPFYKNIWKYCPNCGARMVNDISEVP